MLLHRAQHTAQPHAAASNAAGAIAADTSGTHSFHSTANSQAASIQPENVVYSGPTAQNSKRVTLRTIRQKYEAGETLCVVTAYDYPSAVHVSLLQAMPEAYHMPGL